MQVLSWKVQILLAASWQTDPSGPSSAAARLRVPNRRFRGSLMQAP